MRVAFHRSPTAWLAGVQCNPCKIWTTARAHLQANDASSIRREWAQLKAATQDALSSALYSTYKFISMSSMHAKHLGDGEEGAEMSRGDRRERGRG
jgi:hypothetical protein